MDLFDNKNFENLCLTTVNESITNVQFLLKAWSPKYCMKVASPSFSHISSHHSIVTILPNH